MPTQTQGLQAATNYATALPLSSELPGCPESVPSKGRTEGAPPGGRAATGLSCSPVVPGAPLPGSAEAFDNARGSAPRDDSFCCLKFRLFRQFIFLKFKQFICLSCFCFPGSWHLCDSRAVSAIPPGLATSLSLSPAPQTSCWPAHFRPLHALGDPPSCVDVNQRNQGCSAFPALVPPQLGLPCSDCGHPIMWSAPCRCSALPAAAYPMWMAG